MLSQAWLLSTNRTSQVGPNGAETYTLDALGRLTSATIPGQGTTTYTYDANGNRLTQVNGATATNFTYDDTDQLTLEGTASYTYDNAGNKTARGASTYAWDWRGRMTSATVGGTTTSFTYDGNDVRTNEQTGSTATTYLWDRESGFPLLIDDDANDYVHTGTGDPLTQTGLSSGTPEWLLTSHLGATDDRRGGGCRGGWDDRLCLHANNLVCGTHHRIEAMVARPGAPVRAGS